MIGDKYHVFYSLGGGTITAGVFDTWKEAQTERNERFHDNRAVRAAWIMRDNPSLGLRSELRGATLRRTKHEAARA